MFNIKSKKFKLLVWPLFIIYLFALVHIVLLKSGTAVLIASEIRTKTINLIPFKTIIEYISGQSSMGISVTNIVGNIIAFSPLGFFIPLLLKEDKGLIKTSIISLLISVSFEAAQYQFKLGSCDIDDVILNTLGGIIGFIIYKVIRNSTNIFNS